MELLRNATKGRNAGRPVEERHLPAIDYHTMAKSILEATARARGVGFSQGVVCVQRGKTAEIIPMAPPGDSRGIPRFGLS